MNRLIISILLAMLISINLQPKQRELKRLIENTFFTKIGYGGARGGSKSHAISDLALLYGFKYNTYSLIFRRYYNELLDNHINPLFSRYPQLRNYYNKSDKILYHPITKRPIIRFGFAESEEDIYKFQGISYPLIFVDEATQSTQGMIEWLQSSNRDPEGLFPQKAKMIMTMNPGGVGHTFIKRIFIDKLYSNNEKRNDYAFIQAHVWDNVFWCLKELRMQGYSVSDYYYKWSEQQRIDFTMQYSDYAQTLASLPEQLKLAYLWGDWNVFGGMFFKGFDVSKEVIAPFEIPLEWNIVGSLDPGFAAPLSFGITARDYHNNAYRIGTYYNIDKIPSHAIAIKKWMTSDESPIYPYLKGRIPNITVAGRDAFAKLDKNAIVAHEGTVEDYFRAQGIVLLGGNDGAGSRIANWWKWKSLIPDRYFVFGDEMNQPLLEQMTSVESDDKIVEDIKGRGNDPTIIDHCLDEQKLGLFALFAPASPKTQEELEAEERNKFKRNSVAELQEQTGDYTF